jgi:hypothetical protein
MKVITIVFTKSIKKLPLFSWFIMLWTKKPYSHVAFKLQIKGWKPAYFQASQGRVHYETEEIFLTKNKVVNTISFQIPSDMYSEVNKACFESAGRPYGYAQILGIVLVDLAKIFHIPICNPFKSGEICSEIIYKNVIVPIWGDLGYNENVLKPGDIEDILVANLPDQPLY